MANYLKKFGIWEIDGEYGIIGKGPYEYPIPMYDLWRTIESGGTAYSAVLMHLSEKTWIDRQTLVDLADAIKYAQQQFKEHRPKNAKDESIDRTLAIILDKT